jgi:hypothetical protein
MFVIPPIYKINTEMGRQEIDNGRNEIEVLPVIHLSG